jgi:hypothetical protein
MPFSAAMAPRRFPPDRCGAFLCGPRRDAAARSSRTAQTCWMACNSTIPRAMLGRGTFSASAGSLGNSCSLDRAALGQRLRSWTAHIMLLGKVAAHRRSNRYSPPERLSARHHDGRQATCQHARLRGLASGSPERGYHRAEELGTTQKPIVAPQKSEARRQDPASLLGEEACLAVYGLA